MKINLFNKITGKKEDIVSKLKPMFLPTNDKIKEIVKKDNETDAITYTNANPTSVVLFPDVKKNMYVERGLTTQNLPYYKLFDENDNLVYAYYKGKVSVPVTTSYTTPYQSYGGSATITFPFSFPEIPSIVLSTGFTSIPAKQAATFSSITKTTASIVVELTSSVAAPGIEISFTVFG